jgi:hypothetical protein
MIALTRRLLVALALALWLALPGVGNDGGESGSGVWVLPRATFLTSSSFSGALPVRDEKVVTTLTQDVVMRVSEEMGAPVATFLDSVVATPVALPVIGDRVRLPANLLQALATSPNPTADILVVDAAQMGYVIRVIVDAANSKVVLRVN